MASVVLVAFSAWLLYLSPRQRATRALATLLTSIALLWGSELFVELLPLRAQPFLFRLFPTVLLSVAVSAIYFFCVYPRPRGWIGRSRWSAIGLAALGLALGAFCFAFPQLWAEPVYVDGAIADLMPGPLFLLNNLWSIAISVLLVALAIEHARAPAGPVRSAMALVLAAFMIGAVTWPMTLVLNDLSGRIAAAAFEPPARRVQYLIEEATLLGFLVAVALVGVAALRSDEPARRREGAGIALTAGGALCATVLVWAFGPAPTPGNWTSPEQQVLDAAGGLAIAALCGYALLKHRLFDIEVKLKWTIRRGTVAAIFVAVFFAVSQVAQNFLAESYGWMAGGLVAGLLLFAIAPIQRVADRVAAAAMPGVRDGDATSDKRAAFYRTALAMALTDGVITRDEERHLARLAEQLGLTHTEALALREAVEAETVSRAVSA